MDQESIFISMSPEVIELLADNGIDLVEELKAQGLDVDKGYAQDPAGTDEGRGKDVTLIILASAAAFGAVSMGIAKIIDALGRNKKPLVKERKCVPVTTPSGDVVRDQNGQPILQWVEESRLLEAKETSQDKGKLNVSLGGQKGLRIEFAGGEK